jgi:glucan biosynthesis protein C
MPAASDSTPPPAATRRYDLDWLRTAAVFMLIPYHSSRIFDIWEPFYVKNAQTSAALTLIRALLDPWGMPLLFVVAGAASWLALRRRTAAHYLRERALRLLVPFLFGLVVLVPPQAYVAWLGQGNHGSYWHFFGQYWALRTGEFMGWTGGLTLAHLWFILFLCLFSVVALPLFLALRQPAGSRAIGWLAQLFARPGALLLLVVPFWLTEPLPGPIVGGFNPFAYLFLFIAGFVLIADPRFQVALDRSWRWALGLGALTLAAVVAIRFSGIAFAESSWQSTVRDFVHHLTTWAWVTGLLGFGHCHLNRPRRWLPYLGSAAYPLYIFHQPVIVLLGFYLVPWNAGIWLKFPIIAAAATAITLGLCELARRWSVTRALFGIKSPV